MLQISMKKMNTPTEKETKDINREHTWTKKFMKKYSNSFVLNKCEIDQSLSTKLWLEWGKLIPVLVKCGKTSTHTHN